MTKFNSPAYQWYPKDALSSARMSEMPIKLEGFYRRSLDHAWLNDGLPNDPERVALILGKGCTKDDAERVLEMFEIDKKDASKMRNPRQEIERKKQKENSRKRKEAGRLSGVKRREKKDLGREQTFEQNTNKNEPSYSYSESLFPISFPIPDFDLKRLIQSLAEKKFPNEDIRFVEIGILYTLLQRNGSTEPIKSLQYFVPETSKIVRDCKTLKTNTVDCLLQNRRQLYQDQVRREFDD